MTTCPRPLIWTVFLAVLWVIVGPLSTWAGGSKSDGIEDTGSKSNGTGETEQPESACKNNLPEDYRARNHQPYVDLIVAGLEPDQRARLSQLWKEKLRIDPDMTNQGASFVRILTHVSGEAGKSKHPVDSKSGGNETSDSKTNGLDSPGSRNSDSFTGETTQWNTQKSSR